MSADIPVEAQQSSPHDPLCRNRPNPATRGVCGDCNLITKVRADEREQAATRVEARLSPRWPSHVGTEMWFRKEAIAAVRGES